MDVKNCVTAGAGMHHILAIFDKEGDNIARPAPGVKQSEWYQNNYHVQITVEHVNHLEEVQPIAEVSHVNYQI